MPDKWRLISLVTSRQPLREIPHHVFCLSITVRHLVAYRYITNNIINSTLSGCLLWLYCSNQQHKVSTSFLHVCWRTCTYSCWSTTVCARYVMTRLRNCLTLLAFRPWTTFPTFIHTTRVNRPYATIFDWKRIRKLVTWELNLSPSVWSGRVCEWTAYQVVTGWQTQCKR